ncbi:MAG: hypothetical protein WB784_04775 [Rhodanobacteraceae bacterium]
MNTSWVRSSTVLPREGEPVEFVLDHREVAMDGTYAGRAFRSRWTSYDIERVGAWRLADPTSAERVLETRTKPPRRSLNGLSGEVSAKKGAAKGARKADFCGRRPAPKQSPSKEWRPSFAGERTGASMNRLELG